MTDGGMEGAPFHEPGKHSTFNAQRRRLANPPLSALGRHKAGANPRVWQTRRSLDRGGKRSATPLSPGRTVFKGS